VPDEDDEVPGETEAIERAFGAINRQRILGEYFRRAGEVTPQMAWQHVYRLLLWINPTISLAHCYESDKCQPGKAWYPRSLVFHHWVSQQLDVSPLNLREHIDLLFRSAMPDLAHGESEARRNAAGNLLRGYTDPMPLPGDDADLVELVASTIGLDSLSADTGRLLIERIYTHFARENKRKNLLGRGFEDTLAAVIRRLPSTEAWDVDTRVLLAQIPGFLPQSEHLKRNEVDLALWQPRDRGRRILVSAKWSVRADRERQFESDFEDYSRANKGDPFDYLLVTNEFDAARLHAACTKVSGRDRLFTHVVHVQPKAVLVAYGREADPGRTDGRGRKARELRGHIESGRLLSLSQWLENLTA
jgi:hypothetical protein